MLKVTFTTYPSKLHTHKYVAVYEGASRPKSPKSSRVRLLTFIKAEQANAIVRLLGKHGKNVWIAQDLDRAIYYDVAGVIGFAQWRYGSHLIYPIGSRKWRALGYEIASLMLRRLAVLEENEEKPLPEWQTLMLTDFVDFILDDVDEGRYSGLYLKNHGKRLGVDENWQDVCSKDPMKDLADCLKATD